MRIGELAAATGLTREALRFYESRGLLRARRGRNGYRDYPQQAIELVNYIRLGQSLGFTLAEVGEALPQLWDAETGGGLDEKRLAVLLRDKLAALDARIAGLARLRDELAQRLLLGCPLAAQAAGVGGDSDAGRVARAESMAASTASVRSTRS
jgi:DNA-binding transcriptional MerR regulator